MSCDVCSFFRLYVLISHQSTFLQIPFTEQGTQEDNKRTMKERNELHDYDDDDDYYETKTIEKVGRKKTHTRHKTRSLDEKNVLEENGKKVSSL